MTTPALVRLSFTVAALAAVTAVTPALSAPEPATGSPARVADGPAFDAAGRPTALGGDRRSEPRPRQPLQPPVDDGGDRDRSRGRDDGQDRRAGPRVTPPPRPEGHTLVQPGVTFLHKEGSTETIRRARARHPGSEPRLPDGRPTITPEPGPRR